MGFLLLTKAHSTQKIGIVDVVKHLLAKIKNITNFWIFSRLRLESSSGLIVFLHENHTAAAYG
jgi:hypothetical protein